MLGILRGGKFVSAEESSLEGSLEGSGLPVEGERAVAGGGQAARQWAVGRRGGQTLLQLQRLSLNTTTTADTHWPMQ